MTQKITNEQFFAVLRDNGGLCTQTALAIEKIYGIKYSRQSVYERTKTHPEIVADIRESCIDSAEGGLQQLMETDDERIKLQALQLYLKTIGKTRGYVEKTEVDNTHSFPDKIELTFTKPKDDK